MWLSILTILRIVRGSWSLAVARRSTPNTTQSLPLTQTTEDPYNTHTHTHERMATRTSTSDSARFLGREGGEASSATVELCACAPWRGGRDKIEIVSHLHANGLWFGACVRHAAITPSVPISAGRSHEPQTHPDDLQWLCPFAPRPSSQARSLLAACNERL